MTFEEVAAMLNPSIYKQFRHSLELSRWPDGRPMTKEQKKICVQAVILYEEKNNIPQEQRLGYVGQSCGSGTDSTPDVDNSPDSIRILH